ncbi:ArnT family glycosyltransferase [Cellulomonas sp. P5_C6]
MSAGDATPRPGRLARWLPAGIVAAIALVGGAIRLLGTQWGLPYRLHPDEWVITDGAIDMATRNSFEPPYFFRPDHLEMQLSTLAYRVYAHVTAGVPAEVDYPVNPTPYLALSRAITVAFAVLAIVLAYRVGRRFGVVAGVAAAFLVAFFPPFVAESSFATPDVPLTCVLLAVILASIRYLERPGWLDLTAACFGVALATTVKYPGAIGGALVVLVVTIAAVRTGDWWRALRHAFAAPFLYVAGIFTFSPVLITDLPAVVEQLRAQSGTGHLGADGLGWAGNVGFYAWSLAVGAGLVLLAAAVLGVVACVRERQWLAAPLLLGVAFWVALSALPLHWDRWGLPIYLSPLLFAAIGIDRAVALVRRRRRPALTAVASVLLAATALNLLAGTAAESARLLGHDSRLVAMADFASAGITAQTAVYDGYSPLLPGGTLNVTDHVKLEDGRVVVDGAPDARFVVVSSAMYDRYFADDQYAEQQAVYRAIADQLPLVATWTPEAEPAASVVEPLNVWRLGRYAAAVARGGLVGPTISVYAIPDETG